MINEVSQIYGEGLNYSINGPGRVAISKQQSICILTSYYTSKFHIDYKLEIKKWNQYKGKEKLGENLFSEITKETINILICI